MFLDPLLSWVGLPCELLLHPFTQLTNDNLLIRPSIPPTFTIILSSTPSCIFLPHSFFSVMKTALILSFSALVAGTKLPELQWDPDTVKDCVGWFNNGGNDTCEYVRDLFGIKPQLFTKWNPSVGLDCKPWNIQSYCIITQERVDEYDRTHPTTSTSTTTPASTTTTSTLGPSPTVWTALGCYNDGNPYILDKRMSPEGGDGALTIPKCQDICYRTRARFAGLKQGNECWCSPYVGGEWAKNITECDVPCTGDTKTICGGKGRLNIFKAEEPRTALPPLSQPPQSVPVATERAPAPKTTRSSSGARRNSPLL